MLTAELRTIVSVPVEVKAILIDVIAFGIVAPDLLPTCHRGGFVLYDEPIEELDMA
jgi:hypothetical protein